MSRQTDLWLVPGDVSTWMGRTQLTAPRSRLAPRGSNFTSNVSVLQYGRFFTLSSSVLKPGGTKQHPMHEHTPRTHIHTRSHTHRARPRVRGVKSSFRGQGSPVPVRGRRSARRDTAAGPVLVTLTMWVGTVPWMTKPKSSRYSGRRNLHRAGGWSRPAANNVSRMYNRATVGSCVLVCESVCVLYERVCVCV